MQDAAPEDRVLHAPHRVDTLFQQGRFPFDRLVKFYDMDQIEQALEDSKSGAVIKPILRMPQA